jgi:hypothetical protein
VRVPRPQVRCQHETEHDHDEESRRRRRQPRQKHGNRQADEKNVEHGEREHLRRAEFDGVVERTGDQARVHFHAGQIFAARCGAGID